MQQFLKGIAWQLESPNALWARQNRATAGITSNHTHFTKGLARPKDHNRSPLASDATITSQHNGNSITNSPLLNHHLARLPLVDMALACHPNQTSRQ
jgi:hypothetical protein